MDSEEVEVAAAVAEEHEVSASGGTGVAGKVVGFGLQQGSFRRA